MFLRSIPQGDAQGIAYIGMGAYRPMSAESDFSTKTPQKGVKRIIMSNDTSTTTETNAAATADEATETDISTVKVETVSLAVKSVNDHKSDEEYQSLDKGQKATYRSNVKKAIFAAIDADDIVTAKSHQDHLKAVTSLQSGTSGVSVNPVEVVLKRAAILRAAANQLESGILVPNGLLADDADLDAFQANLADALEADESYEWSEADNTAIMVIATQKVTRSPKLGNVCDHVNAVIADKEWESGSFHKVSETCVKSDIYPTGDSKLNGRISQMLSKMNTGDRIEEDANFKASVRIQGETSTVGFIVL